MNRPDDPIDHDAADDEGPLRKERIDIQRNVSLKFKEFRGFITEFSENISTGGMFIRTTRPQPPGSIFDFEFTLGEDYTLIHGLGEVVWVRDGDEGFDRPAGMGVRFLSLDPDSRRLIDEIVARRLEAGGEGGQEGTFDGWGMADGEQAEAAEPGGGASAAPAWEMSSDGEALLPFGDPEMPGEPERAETAAGSPLTPAALAVPDGLDGLDEAGETDEEPDRPEDALPDLSDLVGDGRRPAPLPPYGADAEEPEVEAPRASSVSPYARSYSSYHAYQSASAGRSRRLSDLLSWRPLGIVLVAVVVVVALVAGFFLLAPEAAVDLLVGSGSGGEETAPAATPEGGEEPAATAPVGGVREMVGERAEPAGSTGQGTPAAGEVPREAAAGSAEGGSPVGTEAGRDGAALAAGSAPGGGANAAGQPGIETSGTAGAAGAAGPGGRAAPSAPAPSEPLPQEPGGEPFTRILNITWEKVADQVEITIHFDGVVREWDYTLVRINAPPPRELIRVRGARQPFPRTTIPVDSDLVQRVRTGFHPRDGEDEIHVVLDLASPDVVVQRSEAVGDEIHVYLGRAEEPEPDGDRAPGRRGS